MFRVVYDEYFDFVWRWARHLGVPNEAMEDVVQEIFVVVHTRMHTVEHPAALRSWIYGVVRRVVSTYRRSRSARGAVEISGVDTRLIAERKPSPLDLAVLRADLQLLGRVLAKLDVQKREVLVMADFEEMPIPAVARALRIPLNTAYSRLHSARTAFQKALELQPALEDRGIHVRERSPETAAEDALRCAEPVDASRGIAQDDIPVDGAARHDGGTSSGPRSSSSGSWALGLPGDEVRRVRPEGSGADHPAPSPGRRRPSRRPTKVVP